MGTFNYSRFRYFDKSGRELIVKPVPRVKISIKNNNIQELGAEYVLVNGYPSTDPIYQHSSMLQIRSGERFNISDPSSELNTVTTISNESGTNTIGGVISNAGGHTLYTLETYTSSNGTENYPKLGYNDGTDSDREFMLGPNNLNIENDSSFFPTYTFGARMNFRKISTGLIETQTLYVLVENENVTDDNGVPMMTSVKEYADTNQDASSYIDRFKLFFFIDCRKQSDFRMFHVKYDEMEWSDRTTLDFRKEQEDGSNENGYSVNIGFVGENDGVYEERLYVCLLDTSTAEEGYPGDAYPIGEILMCAETEGEDERYRTFFTNFGIPDPKEYDDIFNETDINEDLPDFESVNRHSKKMFLAYSEIFPYAGSYKALINAIKFMGYEGEIFFKEWYKEIGNSPTIDSGYTTYDIAYGSKIDRNFLQSTSVEERIHLRKMNWLSMIYKMNIELEETEDLFGFPQTITNYRNFNTDKLIKMIGLKKWLEKYVIGVNCHIIDIGGEGIVFERYSTQKFGTYQTVIDFTREGTISPIIKNDVEMMVDGSANIHVELHPHGNTLTIEDLKDETFGDLCDGYFNETGTFCGFDDNVEDSSVYRYFGKTFEFDNDFESVTIKTKGTHKSYMYNADSSIEGDIHTGFPSILINDNEILFDETHDFGLPLNSPFNRLPFIEIENGIIKRYINDHDGSETLKYYANIYPDSSYGMQFYRIDVLKEDDTDQTKTYWLDEIPTLLPPVSVLSDENVIITPASKRLATDPTVIDMIRSLDMPYNVPMDSSTVQGYNPQPWYTNYGFRFCIDNAHGIPCFKIVGYEEKQIMLGGDRTDHFPLLLHDGSSGQFEYFMEIINGKIIFPDVNKDYVSAINFEYDPESKKRKIYVTTYKDSRYSSLYTYNNGTDIVENFIIGTNYEGFVQNYDTDPESAVLLDNTKNVNVTHAGEYSVSAITYDKGNCVFSKMAEGTCDVKTPSGDINILAVDSSSNNAYETYGTPASIEELVAIFTHMTLQEECIFGYEPKLQINSVDGMRISYNGIQEIADASEGGPGALHTVSKKDFSLATISSMSDRFDIPSWFYDNRNRDIDPSIGDDITAPTFGFIMVRRTNNSSHLFCDTMSERNTILTHMGISNHRIVDILQELTDSRYEVKGTMADVTLFAYNNICEYPIYSAPGAMIPIDEENGIFAFMPLYQMASYFIKNNILQMPNTAFYVIPTWTAPGTLSNLDSEINMLYLSIDFYPFDKLLKQESMGMMHFSNLNGGISHRMKYFGHGSYRIHNMDKSPIIPAAHVYLYASQKPNLNNTLANQSTFDGSIWFSPNSMDFMEYKVDVSSDTSDNTDGYFDMVDNSETSKAKLFIDNQYSVSLRDFDTMYAMQIWNWDTSTYQNTASIETKYSYNIPICVKSPFIGIIPRINDNSYQFQLSYLGKEANYSIEWRVFKRIDGMKRRLVLKCRNRVLYLKLIEHGVYDIEFDYFDRNGNKYTKTMYNAVTYSED